MPQSQKGLISQAMIRKDLGEPEPIMWDTELDNQLSDEFFVFGKMDENIDIMFIAS